MPEGEQDDVALVALDRLQVFDEGPLVEVRVGTGLLPSLAEGGVGLGTVVEPIEELDTAFEAYAIDEGEVPDSVSRIV